MRHSRLISRKRIELYFLAAMFGAAVCPAGAAELQVVTSIKPVHSLASAVMEGVNTPHLLMRGFASPHTFSLRPSDADRLESADVIFLIDESLERSLAGAIESIAEKALVVELAQSRGLNRKPFRETGLFEDESDADHGHGHDEESESHDEHADDDHADHDHGAFDPHVWLDPVNTRAMVQAIADTLAQADPLNADRYVSNADQFNRRLEQLTAQITAEVSSVRDKPFIVFHDAYRYFEERFELTFTGSVVVSPEHPPSAKILRQLRDKIRESGVACVFDEPQFSNRIVSVIVEGTSARTGTIDPLGADIEAGPELYFTLLHNIATSFKDCLSGEE